MQQNTLRLLILEDEPHDAELEIATLEEAGYTCNWERVETRDAFLACLDSPKYDLILSDYALPSFDGLTALKLLLERGVDLPFILVSGTLGEDAAIEGLKAGATDYVMKSRLSRLGPVVRRALEEHSEHRERQRAEDEIADLARFAEENPSPVIRISKEGILLYANPAANALLSEGERKPGTALPEKWKRIVRDSSESDKTEELEVRINASVFSITSTLISERGYVNIYARDITQRKKSEESLMRLSAAIEQSPEAILITDNKGVIQYINPAFEKITGFAGDEVLGSNPSIIKSGKQDDLFYKKLWDTISSGKTWEGRFVNKRKDGSLFTEESSIAPVKNAQGKITSYVAVKRDISEELVREEELRQSQKMEAIGLLAGGVAHDFNNILQAVLGFSELLTYDLNEESQEHQYAVEIRQSALKAVALTKQLLTFGRKEPVDMHLIDLNQAVCDAMSLIEILLGEQYQVLKEFANDLPEIIGDSGQLTQVIMNMAVNARDAMPTGGQLILKTELENLNETDVIALPDGHAGQFISLSIRDTGIGIAPENLSHLFEPFFTTKGVDKGTGLGLSVVYGIMKQSNGWITVSSEKGEGTEFRLYFPVPKALDS